MKNIKRTLLILLYGATFGSLMGISVKYPLTKKTIDDAITRCGDGTFKEIKVGISGRVYEIICTNNIRYIIK